MLKKAFAGLVLTGLLAVPVGIALANDMPERVAPATVEEPDRDQTHDQLRDQDRIQDPTVCDLCPRSSDDPSSLDDFIVPDEVTGDQDQDRIRDRDQLREVDCQDGQPLGDQVRERERMQVRAQDHAGERLQYGPGPVWDA